ncbi:MULTISPECIES: MFS transporter [unclassified Nocardiopsis]|uniref:MFS transporter n=1 Tax=unclassified Nocardiopsis TaxID=2649073 RepID=UPI001357FC98|nr:MULTISPECIES: MFS transporter [unclassified Nocardiopsis]
MPAQTTGRPRGTEAPLTAREHHAPSRLYWTWLAGTGVSALGTQTLVFGLVWHAALLSPGTAAAVLSAQVAPRVLLTLHGGALSDRIGALPVITATHLALCPMALAGAWAMSLTDPGPALMVVTALALGTVDALHLPASASVPQLLVPAAAMGRAMAARQIVLQGTALCGPPLGGAALTLAGLPATYAIGALAYLVMLAVLLRVRSRARRTPSADTAPGPHHRVGRGLAIVFGAPVLRAVVLLTGAFAVFVIPFSSLLVPVVCAARGWDAVTTGTAAGAFGVGMACVSAVVLWRGTAPRAGLAAALGMLTAGAGIAAAAAAPGPTAFCLLSLAAGLGTGAFSTHVAALFMTGCPPDAVGRAQSVVALAQWLPLLWANPLIGVLARTLPVTVLLVLWGTGAGAAAVAALCARPFRTAALPRPTPRPGRRGG